MEELAQELDGFELEETLKRNALQVNQKPMHQQDQVRTWRRWELMQSGMDQAAEGSARTHAAEQLDPHKVYNHEEVSLLVREWRRRDV